jgi:tetratricopeptide (TPR) repeat protein
MKSSWQWIVLPLLFLSTIFTAMAQTSKAELDLGVAAYKDARYEEAIRHFQKAVDLDSGNINARMYLATASLSQYIPGVDTQENKLMAEQAVDQYKQVLDSDAPRDQKINCAKGIAYVYLNLKKLDESRKYYQMASDYDPDDPQPYYSLGVLDWTECYQARMSERAKLGLKPGENLNPQNTDQKRACDELKDKNWSRILHGIEMLKKAINLRPAYDDAMAYMNLMYREKADVECNDLAAREQDLKTADEWVDKTLGFKKAKANRSADPTAPNPQ